METIKHYSGFPATGVSLRQMVQFGEKPSTGKKSRGVDVTFEMVDSINKARCSALHNSSLKSFLYDLHTACKS